MTLTPQGSSHSNEINAWQRIWSNRAVDQKNSDLLEALIKADGCDTGYGNYTKDGWLTMVSDALNRTSVRSNSRILEIGCGSGAFLYAARMISGCNIYGIDYSTSLIQSAITFIPDGNFAVSEARTIPFSDISFDVIFSHGVFFYFPNIEYAEAVLQSSYSRLNHTGRICLMDICDKECEKIYHEERRRYYTNPSEYDSRYADLPHLFYDRNIFSKILSIAEKS
jgi:SAM-dependent methyltransferase